jgi:hypothetical protein
VNRDSGTKSANGLLYGNQVMHRGVPDAFPHGRCEHEFMKTDGRMAVKAYRRQKPHHIPARAAGTTGTYGVFSKCKVLPKSAFH